jgi:hypothetical protein
MPDKTIEAVKVVDVLIWVLGGLITVVGIFAGTLAKLTWTAIKEMKDDIKSGFAALYADREKTDKQISELMVNTTGLEHDLKNLKEQHDKVMDDGKH